MKKFNYNKIISFVLIIGMIMPSIILWPKTTRAQGSLTWYYTLKLTDGSTEEQGPYTEEDCKGLSASAVSLGQGTIETPCADAIAFTPNNNPGDDPESILPSGTPKPGSSAAQALTNKSCAKLLGEQFAKLFGKKVADTFKEKTTEGFDESIGVPVFSVAINDKLSSISDDTSSTKQSTGYLMKKGGCLDSIAKVIIKNMIAYITASLINWINTGFEGKPFFVENPESFFKNIAKNEFLSFANELKDPNKYPFGQNFIKGAAQALKNKFAANAQYSLGNLVARTHPGKTGIDFNANFNIGGWDAYLGMTAPQNNPVGFAMAASSELSIRLDGTQTSKANLLKENIRDAGGFMGDERCVDPKGVTHTEDAKARQGAVGAKKCNRWEYVTPGKLIADKLTNAANSPEKRLEIADDLNSALAALSDALISKGVTTLTNEGLKAFNKDDKPASWDEGAYGSGTTSYGTQFPSFYITPGSWLTNHPDFDLRTGLTQALVDEQRTYIIKLGQYNTALGGLTENVYQLDYCIPGPHPGWEADSRRILDAVEAVIPQYTEEDMKGKSVSQIMKVVAGVAPVIGVAVGAAIAAGAAAGSVVPGLGTAIGAAVGVTIGLIATYFANHPSTEKRLRYYYGGHITALTGLFVDPKEKPKHSKYASNLENYSAAMGVLDTIFDRYTNVINTVYSDPHMPAVTQEAAEEFKKIPAYKQLVENNTKESAFRKSTIARLEELKVKIDDLNSKLEAGAISPDDYEKEFTPQADLVGDFARLTSYLVDGDDIANIDNLLKETKDRSGYVLNDLLKGPHGCEQDLLCANGGDACHLPWKILDTKRAKYPFPIKYPYTTYNSNPLGTGPGFLSNTHFRDRAFDPCYQGQWDLLNWETGKPYYIEVGNLVPIEDNGPGFCTLVGKGTGSGFNDQGAWETTIGIY